MRPPSPSPDVRASHSADGAVLIDVRQGTLFSLNVTGSTVWSGLEQGASPEEIAQGLAHKYHVPQAQVLADILALIRSLEDRQLVVPPS